MRKRFGLKALAGALLAASALPAWGASFPFAVPDLSRQGNLGDSGAFAKEIDVHLGSNAYALDDRLFLVLAGGAFRVTSALQMPTATSDESACGGKAPGLSVAFIGYLKSDFTPAGLLDTTAPAAEFRITARSGGGGSDATCAVLKFMGLSVNKPSFISANDRGRTAVKLTYFATLGTSDPSVPASRFDQTAGDLLHVDDQFAAAAAGVLDGAIDVERQRRVFATAENAQPRAVGGASGFAGDAGLATQDTLALDLKDLKATLNPPVATLAGFKITLTGDFAYLVDANKDGVPDAGQIKLFDATSGTETDITTASGVKITRTDPNTLVFDLPAAAFSATDDVDFRVRFFVSETQPNPLNPTAFAVTVVHPFTNPASPTQQTFASLTGAFAGRWDVNAALVTIPWLPYQGTTLSPIVQVSNRGKLPGAITMDAFDRDGKKCTGIALGSVAGLSTKPLQGAIRNALLAAPCNFDLSDNRVAITLTIGVSPSKIRVYSAYETPTGRTAVLNNTNR